MSSSSSSSHATVTYISMSNDDDVPSWATKAQPLPASISPTALLPDYLADSEPVEEDPKEEHEEDPEEDPKDDPSE
ncbi:hypothetical protein Tco_0891761 [Tanacetum coccineum]|uniref:Uncharacterized protein n=1 Tax=Tanacetum coccineum TaxID=301880 RepID=A0ABQ5C9A2_9ASTR